MSARQNFKYEIGQQVDIGRFHGVITDRYRNNGKRYKYTCVNCGYEGDKLENIIDKGQGCPCCYGRVVKVGFNDITTTAPWMIPYFQGGPEEASKYTSNSHKSIYPRCPYCGEIRKSPLQINVIHDNNGFACACKDKISIPNKIIFDIMRQLKELNIINYFHREYLLDDCPYPYDMYFEKNNSGYLIEMDGGMHQYIQIKHNKKFAYKISHTKDEEKDVKALEINIPLIRIDCYQSDIEYIKNSIENSELSSIFDLSVIDWKRITEFAYGNLIYEVCDYKNDHDDATTKVISDLFGISQSTVMKYLKYGNELGWCHYEAKEAWYKSHENMKINRFYYNEVTDLKSKEKYCFKSVAHIFKDNRIKGLVYTSDYKKITKGIKSDDPSMLNYKGYQIKRISMDDYYKYENIKEK